MNDRDRWNRKWEEDTAAQAPSPLFERMRSSLIKNLRTRPAARALDLACGNGRHALPLARAGIGIDCADCSDVALKRLATTAAREGLPLRTIACDLTSAAESARVLAPSRYDLILDFFFLERALISQMAAALKPGGLMVFETRCAPGEPGSPANPKGYWLAPGELARLLQPHFTVLALGEKPTPGKWLAQAIAIKR